MSELKARDRNVLSTPYKTSAKGACFARIALLRAAPASPLLMMFTLALFACSNAWMTVSVAAKESCVITFNVWGPVGCCPEHEAASRLTSTKARIFFMGFLELDLNLHCFRPPAMDHEQQAGRNTDLRCRLQHFVADAAGP